MDSLLNSDLISYLFLLMRVLAIACFIHALVTRQEIYWMVMLGLGAVFGSYFGLIFTIIYAFQVFFPWLRGRGRVAGQAAKRGVEALKPLDTRIREAQTILTESDTLRNRADLAALQARAGRPDEAQATLQPLLTGIYADDPVVLLTSAELDLARGQAAQAAEKLNHVDLKTSAATRTRALTLLGQALEAQGEDAGSTYQQAMLGATTEEPRARYAAALIRQGKNEEARAVLDAMEKTARQATSTYRRQEREWFDMALNLRKELK